MNNWIKCEERLPEPCKMVSAISVTVEILLHPADGTFYPGGVAPAYYDYEDKAFYWDELSGGHSYAPEAWRYLD